jgi:hypothetical protein
MKGRPLSLPSVVFALSFILLGWIASHSIAYSLGEYMPHGHDHHGEGNMHGYLSVLKLVGGCGLVLGFTLALRAFFRHGSFGEWLHEDGFAGTRKQVALATIPPAAVFVLIEYLERLIVGTDTTPSVQLLVAGVLVQLVVGLLCLALVRATFRVVEHVIHHITRRHPARPVRRTANTGVESILFVLPPCPLASSAAGRAPPAPNVFR